MNASRLRSIERGLDHIFQEAGQNTVWYKYSGTVGDLPEFGLVSPVYFTSYIQAIVDRPSPLERLTPGGAAEQGRLDLLVRESLGKDDMVDLATIRYRVDGAPTPVFLGSTLYYRSPIRRSE